MPAELKELDNGRLLEVHLTGKLVKADYEVFVPVVERQVKQHGKIRMLVEQPFTMAEVRYFDHAKTAEARNWLAGEEEQVDQTK